MPGMARSLARSQSHEQPLQQARRRTVPQRNPKEHHRHHRRKPQDGINQQKRPYERQEKPRQQKDDARHHNGQIPKHHRNTETDQQHELLHRPSSLPDGVHPKGNTPFGPLPPPGGEKKSLTDLTPPPETPAMSGRGKLSLLQQLHRNHHPLHFY